MVGRDVVMFGMEDRGIVSNAMARAYARAADSTRTVRAGAAAWNSSPRAAGLRRAGPSRIIDGVSGASPPDPTRRLVVLSDRPHAWAFLRDHLDPALVRVGWAPDGAWDLLTPVSWMLVGTGRTPPPRAMAALRGRLLCVLWVGTAVAGLPVQATLCSSWSQVAERARRALQNRVGGVRLAPGSGLILPDGSYLAGTAALEVLLAAHPDGIRLLDRCLPVDRSLRAHLRRAAARLERHRLPLRLVVRGDWIGLAPRGWPTPIPSSLPPATASERDVDTT
jgi:hypothetical protein